jgi:hypothetical protein
MCITFFDIFIPTSISLIVVVVVLGLSVVVSILWPEKPVQIKKDKTAKKSVKKTIKGKKK